MSRPDPSSTLDDEDIDPEQAFLSELFSSMDKRIQLLGTLASRRTLGSHLDITRHPVTSLHMDAHTALDPEFVAAQAERARLRALSSRLVESRAGSTRSTARSRSPTAGASRAGGGLHGSPAGAPLQLPSPAAPPLQLQLHAPPPPPQPPRQ